MISDELIDHRGMQALASHRVDTHWAAGLLYHQHIPALLVPLPETEPRAETRPVPRPPLRGGRHVPAHRDLLAFASITPEAADA